MSALEAPRAAREALPRAPITHVAITKLVKSFGATVALRGVDATFKAGRLTLVEGAKAIADRATPIIVRSLPARATRARPSGTR